VADRLIVVYLSKKLWHARKSFPTTYSMSESSNSQPDESASFPIPRMRCIPNPRPAIRPVYEPENSQFNFEMFQLFYSLVMFHLPAYDLGLGIQISPALDTVGKALEQEVPSPLMLDHIVRKFLLHCHGQFLQLTSSPVLAKISQLHNELQLASEVLALHNVAPVIVNYCGMIVAETYDLYNSEFAKTVNREWDSGAAVEAVIDQLLTREIGKIKLLCNRSSECLLQCVIRRAIEKAPAAAVQKITDWAKTNNIPVDK
jgi:hypothetical protein